MHIIDQRLQSLELVLPECTRAAGNYRPTLINGGILYLSAQVPLINGSLEYPGKVGLDLTPQQGYEAARLAALNVLAHIREQTDHWRRFDTLLRVDGYVSSAEGWVQQPQVLDGASDLFSEVLAEQGLHTRMAVACSQLPMNASVELVVTAAITAG